MPLLYPISIRKNNLKLICVLYIDSIRKNSGFSRFFYKTDFNTESDASHNKLVLHKKLRKSQYIDVVL